MGIYKKELKKIAKALNIKLSFSSKSQGGLCRPQNRKITINKNISDKNYLFSLFFHEYAHQVCYDLHFYDTYHRDIKGIRNNKEFQNIMFEAEIFVDRMGRDFCKLYDKSIKYTRMYLAKDKKSIVKFLRDFHKIEN